MRSFRRGQAQANARLVNRNRLASGINLQETTTQVSDENLTLLVNDNAGTRMRLNQVWAEREREHGDGRKSR